MNQFDDRGRSYRVEMTLHDLKDVWGWYLGLGIALVLLGSLAIIYSFAFAVATVIFFAWLLVIAGVSQVAFSFWRRQWGGFVVELLTGLVYFLVGLIIIDRPERAVEVVTLLIALFLMITGVFRIGAAFALQVPQWGWIALSGLISLILGVLIWRQGPAASEWVLGLFIGIELIMSGWPLILLGLFARRLAR